MKIISESHQVVCTEYTRDYVWTATPSSGFSFPCDEAGKICVEDMTDLGKENLRKCQDGTHEVTDKGVNENSWSFMEPSVGKCSCGRKVTLEFSDDNECLCGRLYNLYGQELRRLSAQERAEEAQNDYSYDSEDLY
jgi:hypothetical protein